MTTHDGTDRPSTITRTWRAIETAAAWGCLVLGVTPLFAGLAWPIDLLAQFAPHWLWGVAAATVWLLATRRWGPAVVACVGLVAAGLVWVQPRAERVDPSAADATLLVKVIQYNAWHSADDATDAVQMLRASGADIVAITEPAQALAVEVWPRQWLKDIYPWCMRRPIALNNAWHFVLSRWPITDVSTPGLDENDPRPVTLRIHRPGGGFVFIFVHPQSPRSAERWSRGNVLARIAADEARKWTMQGVPVVLSTDLNSTPTGHRAAILRGGGLRQCRPRWGLTGTYPMGNPSWLRVAIDDVWVSAGVRCADWRLLGGHGADHSAVMATVEVPRAAGDFGPGPKPGYETSWMNQQRK